MAHSLGPSSLLPERSGARADTPARTLILGVAGHIDHGKTALVQALTGVDTDRLPEEQRRGMTIDIGFAHLDLPGLTLGVIDAPGHERFISNMLAGACAVDVALLVVAADDSVMPQTIEHLAILELLGVRRGLVVITKTDLVDDSLIELVQSDVRAAATGTFLASAPIVCASSKVRTGLDGVKSALAGICQDVCARRDADLFRLAVDRSFVMPSVGTVVTGTVRSGRISVGDTIEWSPPGRMVKVKGLQSHGNRVDSVCRGERAAMQLANVHHREIKRGHELAKQGYLKPTRSLTVRLRALAQSPRPIKHRSRVRLHLGAGHVMATVRLLGASAIEPGRSDYAQLLCAEPVVATGRQPFVIRSESPVETIGGGSVLLASPRRIQRGGGDEIAWLEQLEQGDSTSRCESVIRLFGLVGLTELDLCRQADVPLKSVAGELSILEQTGAIRRVVASAGQPQFIHREVWQELLRRIITALGRLHARDPMAPTIPMAQLEQEMRSVAGSVVRTVVCDALITKQIAGSIRSIALPTHRPPLDAAQDVLRQAILDVYRTAGFSPPSAPQLASSLDASVKQIESILTLAAGQGELIHLGGVLFLHRDHHEAMLRLLREQLLAEDGMAVSQVRDLLKTSRKYAVPICEHLDRIQFTKRRGDLRVLNQSFVMNESRV